MYAGSLPAPSIWGTWIENVEVTASDDGSLIDLSSLTEITLQLRDPKTGYRDLVLSMTNGDIVTPSNGIIQWRAEQGAMYQLAGRLYEVIMILSDPDAGEIPLILGTVSILE